MSRNLIYLNAVSTRVVSKALSLSCSIVAGLILVLGFSKLEKMELTEIQLYSAVNETLLLAGLFVILALVVNQLRRAR